MNVDWRMKEEKAAHHQLFHQSPINIQSIKNIDWFLLIRELIERLLMELIKRNIITVSCYI